MKVSSFLSSNDIYIEINGVKLAIVQDYHLSIAKQMYPICSFNSDQPITNIAENLTYQINISRICLLDNLNLNSIDFLSLSNFNLIIYKPSSSIIFSGCEWISIDEKVSSNNSIIESISISATKCINKECLIC